MELERVAKMKFEADQLQQALLEKKRKLEVANRRKLREEMAEVDRAKQLLREEHEQREEQKRLNAIQVERVKQENARLLLAKKQARNKLQEEEAAMCLAYKQKLDRQEKDRELALQRTYALQEKKVNMALLNVKSDAEISREHEQRALEAQRKANEKAEALHAAKLKKQRQAQLEQYAYLEKQKQERIEGLNREKNENLAQAKVFAKDVQLFQEVEANKKKKVQYSNKQHQLKLHEQMKIDEQRKRDMDKYGMSSTEMQLNSTLFKKFNISKPLAIAGNVQLNKK